ncbi:uncharacterized protein LOC142767722 [Rhipicephalus microplus]|uniref:uncharacterized protein LOC142767722 n=1 Tax=Rhipicephalus microplus TaxID=6941 RepID=UPI003F6B7A1A
MTAVEAKVTLLFVRALTVLIYSTVSKPAFPIPQTPAVDHKITLVNRATVLPGDGLCDYTFFDSLAVAPENNSFAYSLQNFYVQLFATQSQGFKKTKYGMSVALSDVVAFSNAYRSPTGHADLESYWIYNIFSWGFLHIDELQAESKISDVGLALQTLKEINQHTMTTAGFNLGTFLGIFMRANQTCSAVGSYLYTIFAPTGVILLGHLSYGDFWRPDCAIMPPINFVDPRVEKPGISYGHRMRDAMLALACLASEGVQTSLYLSVTMQARRYKLKNTSRGQSLFYTDCGTGTYEQRVSAQEICNNPFSGYSRNIYYSRKYRSPITYDDGDGYAITFENFESLRAKICSSWSLGAIDLRVGLAVYDVNYDSRNTTCDALRITGPWSLFHFLMRLRDFLHQPTRSSSDFVRECDRVT